MSLYRALRLTEVNLGPSIPLVNLFLFQDFSFELVDMMVYNIYVYQ